MQFFILGEHSIHPVQNSSEAGTEGELLSNGHLKELRDWLAVRA